MAVVDPPGECEAALLAGGDSPVAPGQAPRPENSSPPQAAQPLSTWLYLSTFAGGGSGGGGSGGGGASSTITITPTRLADDLASMCAALCRSGRWEVRRTSCGVVAGLSSDADADRLLHADLAMVLGGAVQVARLCGRDVRCRQGVLLREVPWAVPMQDVTAALQKQGIAPGSVERVRHLVRVEVGDSAQYETLLRDGLDFYGVARFAAMPERYWYGPGVVVNAAGSAASSAASSAANSAANSGIATSPLPTAPAAGDPSLLQGPALNAISQGTNMAADQQDYVLQCYRCQGFWHVAANCRHLPRCVRCGEPHSVEFCPRPRSDPVCCHCAGPHHAAYRQCPVRLQLVNATPVSITMTSGRGTAGNHGLSNGSNISGPAAGSSGRGEGAV